MQLVPEGSNCILHEGVLPQTARNLYVMRLTPGSEAVQDIPEAVYSTTREELSWVKLTCLLCLCLYIPLSFHINTRAVE